MAGYYPTAIDFGGTNTVAWNTVVTCNNTVWVYWNSCYPVTGNYPVNGITGVTNQTVCGYWCGQLPEPVSVNVNYQLPPETDEQREQRETAARKVQEDRERAQTKAKELLVAALDKHQREQFQKEKAFELQVNEKLYRIRPGSRVERLDSKTKKVQSFFCIHPSYEHHLPEEDVALGQKLLLESAESEFLRIANETRAA